MTAVRILGIDPGLRCLGWGIVAAEGNRLSYVACGVIVPDDTQSLAMRLCDLHSALHAVVMRYQPDEAAVEETFVNTNPVSTLKLGQARGICLLVPAQMGLSVHEYAPNLIKKTVVGAGKADKAQVQAMVKILLPKAVFTKADAADALAIAITHAHHRALHSCVKIG